MRFKRPIYRILFFAAWIVVLAGIVILLVAANRRNKEHICKGVEVSINGGSDKLFVEKVDVIKSMEKTANGALVKKHFGEINLTLLEKNLEANPWIRDAELYFDTKDVLHVAVSEREPVARIFTTAGNSFYMDSAGYAMPLVDKISAKLPVVTGFTAAKKWSVRDSVIVRGLKHLVHFIGGQEFWNAQIGQIDITSEGKFELVPTIGDHVIKLGVAENVEEKLNKLFVFYKQVLPKAGFAKYSALDIQFEGQVIAVKGPIQSPIDSIQLQKNIQELMLKKAAEQEAEGMLPEETLPIAIAPIVASKNEKSTPVLRTDNNPTPVKTTEQKSNPDKPKQTTPTVRKPKAVMQKRG